MYIIRECTKCKEYKLLEEFSKKKGGAFGRNSRCNCCNKEHEKQWREQNKERIKEYRKQNKERIKEYVKQYYEQNKERIKEYRKEYDKQYREQNKERIKEYYEQNKKQVLEKHKEYFKQRKQTDPLFKLRCNISSLISNSIIKQGYTKKSRTHQILGCNFETFKKHIERQFTKGMTWKNHGEWHLDHIYPVSLAKNEEELIKLNHYTNFQPLWAEDNLRKSNNIEEHQLMMRI